MNKLFLKVKYKSFQKDYQKSRDKADKNYDKYLTIKGNYNNLLAEYIEYIHKTESTEK